VALRKEEGKPERTRRQRRSRETPEALTADDAVVFETLRAWRRQEAARQHLPPYVIFQDRTLAEIARRRPKTATDLAGIAGVGEVKLQRYGSAVLGVLRSGAIDEAEGLPTTIVDQAQALRSEASLPERVLWRQLRNRQLDGFKFRRQHPMEPYVLDFFCPELRLCVEIDGYGHLMGDSPERDQRRDAWLDAQGIRTVRIQAKDVLSDLSGVIMNLQAQVRLRL
jgi:ATP-dependent DNA helicase RecQ